MRTLAVILSGIILCIFPVFQGCGDADNGKPADNLSDIDGGYTAGGGDAIGKSAVVSVLKINFRVGPSPNEAPVARRPVLYYGAVLEVLETEGEWLKVRHTSGDEGWVRSRYEGKEYVRTSDEPLDEMLSSEGFLERRADAICDWAPDARIYLLWGIGADFDGFAREWAAFFVADSKPGLKLYVDAEKVSEWPIDEPPPSPELGTDAHDEEYLEDVSGLVADALRLSYYTPYKGAPDPITSVGLCSPGNIDAFLSSEPVQRDRSIIEDGYASVELLLAGEVWKIMFTQGPYSGIVGEFDPLTGKFLTAYGELLYKDSSGA
jgi:hypothetical protein